MIGGFHIRAEVGKFYIFSLRNSGNSGEENGKYVGECIISDTQDSLLIKFKKEFDGHDAGSSGEIFSGRRCWWISCRYILRKATFDEYIMELL